MVDKNTKSSFSLEEGNLAEQVRSYHAYIFEKSVEGYKEKQVVIDAWNEVAINLNILEATEAIITES